MRSSLEAHRQANPLLMKLLIGTTRKSSQERINTWTWKMLLMQHLFPLPSPLSPLPSFTPSSIGSLPGRRPRAGSAIRWKRPSTRGRAGAACSSRIRAAVSLSPLLSPLSPHNRRPTLAANDIQCAIGLRGLRDRISSARAAAVQFQQPVGGLSDVRGFRQRRGPGHGADRSRPEQVAPRRGDCAVEHAGLRPRVEKAAVRGPALRLAGGRAFPRVDRGAAKRGASRPAGAGLRRPGRVFRLARAAEVQDARPRVSQPLAEFPHLPGLRRRPAAARGVGRAARRPEPRRDLRDEGPRRRQRCSPASNFRTTSGRSAA